MNPVQVADSICSTMKRAGHPLTDDQRTMLAGALGIWLNKAQEVRTLEFNEQAVKVCLDLGDAASKVITQCLKGSWRDDLGHPATNNVAMIRLVDALNGASALLAVLTPQIVEKSGPQVH